MFMQVAIFIPADEQESLSRMITGAAPGETIIIRSQKGPVVLR